MFVVYFMLIGCSGAAFRSFLTEHKRRQQCFDHDDTDTQWLAVVGAMKEMHVMSELIADALSRNDQLPFKVFMVVVNVVALLCQYVWNTYVNPSRIYNCAME